MTDLAHSGFASIPGGDEASGASMLERAARALAFSFVSDSGRGIHLTAAEYADHSWEQWVPQARAVLLAVREASDDTLDGQCFRDMLDDILADGEGR